MAHVNINERRYAVWEALGDRDGLNRLECLRVAFRFGCTVAAIYADIADVAGRSTPPHRDGIYEGGCGENRWYKACIATLERCGCRCSYCGIEAFDIDHVVPRAAGGNDDHDNLTVSCRSCNSRKSAFPLNLFNPVFASSRAKGFRLNGATRAAQ